MSSLGKPGANGFPGYAYTKPTANEDEDDLSEHGAATPHRPARPDRVFNLSLEDEDDGSVLLDLEQYNARHRVRCCGCDCAPVVAWLPCCACWRPGWWYRSSKTQQRVAALCIFGGFVAMLAATVAAGLLGFSMLRSWGGADARSGGGQAAPVADVNFTAYEECAWTAFRLPASVAPVRYDLRLSVLQLAPPSEVTGSVAIELDVQTPTPCVVLHAAHMNITGVTLLGMGVKDGIPGDWRLAGGNLQQLTLQFPALLRSSVTVSIEFSYPLRDALSGFYRSTFSTGDGVQQYLATTQFESTSARKAFPCFDEPALKAEFAFEMESPDGLAVLFNTELKATVWTSAGRHRRTFHPTPRMASYLVAFIVGNLTTIEQSVPGALDPSTRHLVRVWGTPDRSQDLLTALRLATRILPAYERTFGVAYPLAKLDLVAIPDFAAGAMENWGLITFRETALLVTNTASVADRMRVAIVIAHEMAHLWFGDLVTMEYWGELFLNEGFASYLEFVGAEAVQPEFRYLDRFYVNDAVAGLAADVLNSSHPLASFTGIDNNDRIESFFDNVSYQKGGAVLRMLRAWLTRRDHPAALQPRLRRQLSVLRDSPGGAGDAQWRHRRRTLGTDDAATTAESFSAPDVFFAGLNRYLKQYAFSNANAAGLWNALSEASGENVTRMMAGWTYRAGYPLVSVQNVGPESDGVFALAQAPFSIHGPGQCVDGADGGNESRPWWVPVSFRTSSRAPAAWTYIDACAPGQPIARLQGDSEWVKINADQLGFYRVNYPPTMWARLAAAAQAPATIDTDGFARSFGLTAVDIAGLLEDSFALADAGLLTIDVHLDLLRSLGLRRVVEYSPWDAAMTSLTRIRRLLAADADGGLACGPAWQRFVLSNLTDPLLQTVGGLDAMLASESYSGGNDIELQLLRPLALEAAGTFGNEEVRQRGLALLLANKDSGAVIPADVRGVVYRLAVQSGDQRAYDIVKAMYLQASTADEESRTLMTLAYATSETLIDATLDFAIGPDVRSQNSAGLIGLVAGRGGTSLRLAWSFLQRRYDDIFAKLGGDVEAARAMGPLLSRIGSNFVTAEAGAELEAVFAAHASQLQETRYLDSARESIGANVAWLKRSGPPLCAWLATQTGLG